MFIAHDQDTPRAELSRQVFIVCECAEQSFQRLLRSQVDENFRLVWMNVCQRSFPHVKACALLPTGDVLVPTRRPVQDRR